MRTNLRELQKALKVFKTQRHMAEVMKVRPQSVSNWFSRKSNISLKNAIKLQKLTSGLVNAKKLCGLKNL